MLFLVEKKLLFLIVRFSVELVCLSGLIEKFCWMVLIEVLMFWIIFGLV